MSAKIELAAIVTSVQDSGRIGYRRFGLPPSGPMDWRAFGAANHLVGNSPDNACLEIGFTPCSLRLSDDALLAVCGAGYKLFHNHKLVPLWMSFLAKRDDQITLEKSSGGNWVYLAFSGGIQSERWLSSRCVYPRGQLGRYHQEGDVLPVVKMSPQARTLAGRSFPVYLRPAYSRKPILRVVDGPDVDRINAESLDRFFSQSYQVSSQSDRMGYRLNGAPILHTEGADVISRGMSMGEIQVPGDGQPIVMMADHPTTGGYTSLGTIAKVDWPLIAQSQPGDAEVRFSRSSVDEAQTALKELNEKIKLHQYEQEDLWLNL